MKVLSIFALWVSLLAPTNAFAPNGLGKASPIVVSRQERMQLQAAGPSEEDLKRFQSYGEASRKLRRSYFSHSDWLKARADDRFLYNLSSIVRSGILRQLSKELVIIALISTFICVWNALFAVGYDDLEGFHHAAIFGQNSLPLLVLPANPFTLSVPSLGLLLVFRTNTAYKRWDEGRKAWGSIINNSRTCVRLGTSWSDKEGDGDKEKLALLADAVWSFPRSLQFHMLGPLEDGVDFAKDLQQLKNKVFANDLLSVRHKPTRSLREITAVLNTINFKSIIYQVETEKAVSALCDALGACERIFTSPPPLFYSRHTARFLVTWLFLLPLCLYQPFENTWNHWGMIPSAVVISYFLLGIEELVCFDFRRGSVVFEDLNISHIIIPSFYRRRKWKNRSVSCPWTK
jgi:putative membrane protein